MNNKIKEIVIDSRDRTIGSASSSDFTVELKKRLNISQVGVLSANLYFTWYNITSSNNKIDFDEGIGELTATITPGYYTTARLVTAIQTEMDNAGANTYTVTFSTTTLKTTITATGNFTLLFSSGTNVNLSTSKILGFETLDTSLASTHIGTNVFNMNNIHYILVKLITSTGSYNSVTSTNTNDNSVGNIAVIPVQTNSGSLIRYCSYDPVMTKINCDAISSLHIQLKSWNDQDIDLNGGEWSMILRTITTQGGQ